MFYIWLIGVVLSGLVCSWSLGQIDVADQGNMRGLVVCSIVWPLVLVCLPFYVTYRISLSRSKKKG